MRAKVIHPNLVIDDEVQEVGTVIETTAAHCANSRKLEPAGDAPAAKTPQARKPQARKAANK